MVPTKRIGQSTSGLGKPNEAGQPPLVSFILKNMLQWAARGLCLNRQIAQGTGRNGCGGLRGQYNMSAYPGKADLAMGLVPVAAVGERGIICVVMEET